MAPRVAAGLGAIPALEPFAVGIPVLEPLAACGRRRFRGGLVFKAHRLFYHSTLGSRVIKKKEEEEVDSIFEHDFRDGPGGNVRHDGGALSVYMYLSLSLSLSISLSLARSLSLSPSLPLCLSFCLSLSLGRSSSSVRV